MKQGSFHLAAAIAVTLAAPSAAAHYSMSEVSLRTANMVEAPRIIRIVDSSNTRTLPATHLARIHQDRLIEPVPDNTPLNHLQLLLEPSDARREAMEDFIASQHAPGSANFQHWLTPRQFGAAFGVVDSDVTAVTSWLAAQGFAVNVVYPNAMLIDFSGTVGQVRAAFHTQENFYAAGAYRYRANAADITVPAALKNVVAGVAGLSNLRLLADRNSASAAAAMPGYAATPGRPGPRRPGANAVPEPGYPVPARALVPNDVVTMYGARAIRDNGVVGSGVTIAFVSDENIATRGWTNFVDTFNLSRYGGTLALIHPQPLTGSVNCQRPDDNALNNDIAAEWATAMAPGAHIVIASCATIDSDGNETTTNPFGGLFIAASNLINGDSRPNIIGATSALGESRVAGPDKAAIDLLWAQADAEGISVFVQTGDYGVNANQVGAAISYPPTIDMNALATSSHVTAVGGTDLADVLDGTTRKYFAAKPSAVGGSALSYVPEIAWNETCGNGVLAKHLGFNRVIGYCRAIVRGDIYNYGGYVAPNAGSGGPSAQVAKPAWQKIVHNAAADGYRDVPDVALFAGSVAQTTLVMTCLQYSPCNAGGLGGYPLEGGTALSTAMFAGIQALMDQGLAARGLPLDQGNAAPTLYALAAKEYGTASGSAPASLATCNADNGATGSDNCVFHNITRGSISTPCTEVLPGNPTLNCYFYDSTTTPGNTTARGLTTSDANPTQYGVDNKAYGAQPGWSFATGLGSVNAKNLLIAWRAFLQVPAAAP